MKTKRRSIAFKAAQMDWLEKNARERGITVAAMVRRIIDAERDPNIKRMQEITDVTRKAMLPALFRSIVGA